MTVFQPLYFLEQTVKNLWRNRGLTLASVLILIACLLVSGTFFVINENINYNLDGLGGLNKILVYIDETVPDDEIRALKAKVEGYDNVASVTLITKEEALEDEKDKLGEEYSGVFDWLQGDENPYRASLEVEYADNVGVEELEEKLAQTEGVDTVVSRSETAGKVEQVKRVFTGIFMVMMILLFVVSIFVIISAIRLAMISRSKEITVMRYVGATGFFIATPYLIEGALLGLVAALIAYGIEQYVYSFVATAIINEFFGLISVVSPSAFTLSLLIGFATIGVGTGLVGSSISVAKYLKV